jgi:metal-responsive CopG/Arc/MetJ family transcriptional regulator
MKTKISISLPQKLIDEIDDEAARTDVSRSQLIELWLRTAKRQKAREQLDEEIRAYYENRTPEQEAEDEALSRASLRLARQRRID